VDVPLGDTILNGRRAREILGSSVQSDGSLHDTTQQYMWWSPGDSTITLDSEFTLEELEAIVWWLKNSK
jgi:hypothetical protein